MATASLQSGTYRIVHLSGRAAIQAMDDAPTKLAVWERHEGENQQWFVQQVGDGYTFKNRRHGLYVAVKSTTIGADREPLHGSKYPIPWALLPHNDCYYITFPENINRVLCADHYSAENGTPLVFWPSRNEPRAPWRLEKLNDETGETAPRNETTIHQLQEIAKVKDEALALVFKANEEIAHLRDQQAQLQFKLLQSQLAELQSRVDRLEHPKSQATNKDESGTYPGVYGGA